MRRVQLLSLFGISVCVLGSARAGESLYVDADAPSGGDGLSWTAPYCWLQDALSAAADSGGQVSEIRVGGGRYAADLGANQTVGDRDATFMLLSGVSIRGGFAGFDSDNPDARDPLLYRSVLSGDLNGDDEPNWKNHAENSRHILTAVNVDHSAVLDGFTIRAGYASYPEYVAGALLISTASPVILDCNFEENLAHSGGAIAVLGGSPEFEGCLLLGNYAWDGRGGAIYVDTESGIRVRRSTFVANSSYGAGGVGDGGAIFNSLDTTTAFIDCVFRQNSCAARMLNFAFGGAIANLGSGMVVQNCMFLANSSQAGGAIWSGRASVYVNSVFSGNTAIVGGGLAHFMGDFALINCALSGNAATEDGGGIENAYGTTTIANCIIWGNLADAPTEFKKQIHNGSGGISIRYSCVMGVFTPEEGEDPPDPKDFPGCIEDDPLFVDPNGADNYAGTLDDDLRLQHGSPAIDAADNLVLPADDFDLDFDGNLSEELPIDLDGQPRRFDDANTIDTGNGSAPLVDMGVYEFGERSRGDMNCDGSIDFNDIDPFVAALISRENFESQFPGCDYILADINQDGSIDFNDIDGFVECIVNSGCP